MNDRTAKPGSLFATLRARLQERHYSDSTERSYAGCHCAVKRVGITKPASCYGLRHQTSRSRLRHSNHPGASRPPGRRNNDDLYPRLEPRTVRCAKSNRLKPQCIPLRSGSYPNGLVRFYRQTQRRNWNYSRGIRPSHCGHYHLTWTSAFWDRLV